MRRQYHFRPSPQGLLAWDVHRLIELAHDLPVEVVALTAIGEINEPWWFAYGEMPTVAAIVDHIRLMDAADLSYPILLCPQGRLMDGMHRVAKALYSGQERIRVKRLRILPEPDYVGADPGSLPYDD